MAGPHRLRQTLKIAWIQHQPRRGALKDVMGQQEVKDALVAQGAMPTFTTPAEARAQIAEEVATAMKYDKVRPPAPAPAAAPARAV